jgi:hypothetical protein
MGHERKRGKLGDLNALLRGGSRDGFSLIVGDTSQLVGTKYVITLDTDTLLPRDAARQLVGTLAHILNHAQVDERRKVVKEGYGILQPGVAISLEKGSPSWFVRLCAGESGVDPYTRAISDVYQDVFGEGSFIGKGIYDVDAFTATMERRFPKIKSSATTCWKAATHGRLGRRCPCLRKLPLAYTTRMSPAASWIRGDWQIAGWLLPFVWADRRSIPNQINLLGRWKLFDKPARSIVPCALTLLLLLGWLALPPRGCGRRPSWDCFDPSRVHVARVPCSASRWICRWFRICGTLAKSVCLNVARATLTIVFLPYEAYFSLDAIVRTGVRMRFTPTHAGMEDCQRCRAWRQHPGRKLPHDVVRTGMGQDHRRRADHLEAGGLVGCSSAPAGTVAAVAGDRLEDWSNRLAKQRS